MKLLAFSDLHRSTRAAHAIVEASGTADVIVGAGDFGTRGNGALETLTILKSSLAPVVLVHGNHDNPTELKSFCKLWPKGHYLHGQAITLDGYTFFGLGGEIPSRNDAPWNATETESIAEKMLARCPKHAVLVTHTPPLGSADLQKDGMHEGSTAIRDAILSQQPVLHLCGHIHHAWGMTDRLGATRIHNLGPGITWFEV